MKRCRIQGKVMFRDAAQASRSVKPGESMRVYRCPHCHFFHLTTNGKKANAVHDS